jgi:hypothetical protein
VASVAEGASRAGSWVAAVAAGALAAGVLAACGSTASLPRAAPSAHSAAERAWVEYAGRFVAGLQTEILSSQNGGADLASARRAIGNENDIYTMLVDYTDFGDCNRQLGDVGVPAPGSEKVVALIVSACGRLERASSLFQDAMTYNQPTKLLAATRLAARAAPLLAEAEDGLAKLSAR